ncbi:MAG: helix-turn-helix domain-containing protein [Dehalococcoidia bacterium]
MVRQYNQPCPIALTLDIVGDRWTLIILRDLRFGLTKFSEVLANSPGLPPRILSERLKKLVEHGLVERVVYSEHPLRAEYRLTEKGISLEPVMEAIAAWGMQHLLEDGERAAVQSRLREVLGHEVGAASAD